VKVLLDLANEIGYLSVSAIFHKYLPADMVKNTTAGSDAAQSRPFRRFSFWWQYRHGELPYCRSDEAVSALAHPENPTIEEQSSAQTPFTERHDHIYHNSIKLGWVELVGFYFPLDTQYIISDTSLPKHLTALVLTTKNKETK